MTNEEKKTDEVTGPPDQFVGRDLLESYMYYRNYIPSNPYEAYVIKKKCIEFGKELLPPFIDLDEKDEQKIKENKEEQEKTDKLYENACSALTTEIPEKRQIKYKYLDKGNRVYELKASDADNCEVVKDELEIVKNDFTNQQHEQHMGTLEKIDNEIFHVLSMTGIVPSINPTYKEIKEGWKKQRIRKRQEKLEKQET